MKERLNYIILIVSLLISCDRNSNEINIRQKLEGQWSWNGKYISDKLVYDTIYTTLTSDFDYGYKEIKSHHIRTDSGIYTHTYSDNNYSINPKLELFISEYYFAGDSIGLVIYYELNLDENYREHPRIFANKEHFQLKSENGLNYFMFAISGIDTLKIEFAFVNSDTMKIILDKDEYNLFTKVKNAR